MEVISALNHIRKKLLFWKLDSINDSSVFGQFKQNRRSHLNRSSCDPHTYVQTSIPAFILKAFKVKPGLNQMWMRRKCSKGIKDEVWLNAIFSLMGFINRFFYIKRFIVFFFNVSNQSSGFDHQRPLFSITSASLKLHVLTLWEWIFCR